VDETSVPGQRCIVYTLNTASKKARAQLKGKENQEQRKRLGEQAAAIDQAHTAIGAQVALAHWFEQWQKQAPPPVATHSQDVAQTLVFSQISGLKLTWLRTTSLVERTTHE